MSIFDVGHVGVFPPDLQYVGDLGLLRPSSKPSIASFIKGKNGFEPNEDFKSGIEAKINEFFRDKGWQLLPEWKNSLARENFEYAVALVDDSVNKNAGEFTYDSIIGLLVAFTIEIPGGFKMRYYDKIGVRNDKRGNGYMSDLIKEARRIDLGLDQERESGKSYPTPAGLRTSEKENDERYGKISDYRLIFSGNGTRQSNYFIHLFGFKGADKKPILPYVDRMYGVEEHIGNLPSTFKKAA